MNPSPVRGSLYYGLLRTFYARHCSIFRRSRHTFCALSSEDYKVSRLDDIDQNPFEYDPYSPLCPAKHRLPWDVRLNGPTLERQSTQTRIPFSSYNNALRRYIPYAQELIHGLWSLDQDPTWILVDNLVATGEPQSSSDAFPEFQRWKHIIMLHHFSDATSTLVAQGYLRYQPSLNDKEEGNEEEKEEEDEEVQGVHDHSEFTIPTWVVAYMLTTMTNTRVEAYEGLAFCLSQLDTTPKHLRTSLLLLSMCSLSTHNVTVQVPILLAGFQDLSSSKVSDVDETNHSPPFGSQESLIYQYNVLLSLLSQFPQVPGFARRTIQFVQHMEASGVPLDLDTAKKLTASRFATNLLVAKVRDVLERQGIRGTQEQSDDISFTLLRFYAKRSNQAEASKFAETSLQTHPGTFAQAYLRSFRDAAEAFAYLKNPETRKDQKLEDKSDIDRVNPSISDQKRATPTSSIASFRGVTKRHVYTSLLHSASVCKTISAETFRNLFMTIRETCGDDRELETVALTGMLKRNAWEQAKDIWNQWETTNRSIRSILHEMRTFLKKRQKNFGDARKVRRTLGWSELTEQVTCRRMDMLSVDANALSVVVRALAGPKPDSLAGAFATMDEYALKMQNPRSAHPGSVSGTEPVVEQIQLTSRVINCFMVRAMYFRRPDVVFRLWDGMTSYYGVDCSPTTLDILIRSARLAASMETALSQITPKWMKISRDFFAGRPVFPNLGAEILWMLSPSYSPNPRWDGVPAWRMVRYLFREEILFANWPWLRYVDIPAQAIRGDNATGQVEAFKELRLHGGLWGTQVRKMGNYPHLMPSPRIFREYIIMLGRVHRSSEIPEVLAWMKALNILPSRRALSHSLALWSQVGLESLPDDAWGSAKSTHVSPIGNESSRAHARHGGEYDRLLAWLEDWVGKENMPGDGEVLESFKYIQRVEERELFLY